MAEIFFNCDIDILKEYLTANPDLLNDLNRILKYRNLRSEQAYYALLAKEYDTNIMSKNKIVKNAGEMDRSYWGYLIETLDKQRRDRHNEALTSFNNFLETGYKYGLDYIYIGPTLTDKEITGYLYSERRAYITDAMFKLLAVLEDAAIEKTAPSYTTESLHSVQKDMNRFNRDYNIKQSLLSDESKEENGGIEFDFKPTNTLNNNVNL